MNDFENSIRDMPWREPGKAIRDKIFGGDLEPRLKDGRQFNIPIKWCVALATAAGFLGFMAGTMLSNRTAYGTVASIGTDIRVVETFSPRNSFDFSAGAIQILPGEFTTSISVEGEAESER